MHSTVGIRVPRILPQRIGDYQDQAIIGTGHKNNLTIFIYLEDPILQQDIHHFGHLNPQFQFYGGISVGYNFKKKK